MASKKVGNFEVQGLKELQKQLLTFDHDVMKTATRRAAKAAMDPVADRAKAGVPVDHGTLRDTIKVSSGTTDQGQVNRVAWAVVRAGGKGAKGASGESPGGYVLSMHYGNSKGIDETPFLIDAIEPHAQGVSSHFARELTIETEKGVKKMAQRAKNKK